MQSLLERRGRGGRQGLSRRGRKGGTMGDYAAKISHLIRRCYRDRSDFIELNDSTFTDYIEELRKERSSRNPIQLQRTENGVIAIGRQWLDFLSFIGRFHGDSNFVSVDGTIRAREETRATTGRNGKKIYHTYITHHSFGVVNRLHRRKPITDEQIEKLKDAITNAKSSSFVKQRRRCMLELFKDTGARRSEVGNILIEDILAAFKMEQPLLRLETLKQAERSERYVRVTKMLLHDIKNFIQISRKKLMKLVYKDGADHGFLFVSETTGRKFSNDSISNEFSLLRKLANIEEQICPHMFRHAFITNMFALLIQEHEITNADHFRRSLLDSHIFITEIMQWTGQLTPTAVEHYINLAFKSVAKFSQTRSSVHMIIAMRIFFEKQDQLMEMLEQGMPLKEYKERIKKLKELAEQDYEIARTIGLQGEQVLVDLEKQRREQI
jgi:integrase